MLRRWLVGGLAVGMLASVLLAKPGTVRTRDGTVFQGDVTEEEKFVAIKSHGITTRLDKRNIPAGGIQYTASIDDQFNERLANLAANDLKGRIDLSKWATENQRPDLAVKALEEATKIDPANRDAALLLDTAQREVELDQRKKGASPAAGINPETAEGTTRPASQPVAGAAGGKPVLEHRLLNADEINLIRQKEMIQKDAKVTVKFQNDVVKKFLATGDRDVAGFRQLSPVEQAEEILDHGDKKLANDVRIMTDPTPMVEFKQKVYPIIANSCGSTGCHGGTHAGSFGLYPGESPAAVYTNFYILQNYSSLVNGTQQALLDRVSPERSLFLQFALPASEVDVAHPKAPNYRPRFRTKTDAGYTQVLDWLTNSLNPVAPTYGIKVSAKLPATQPAAGGK